MPILKVATFGPKGTFTDEAAGKVFPGAGVAFGYSDISGVFEEIAKGKATFGVVPIENSTEGSVSETLECLRNYDVEIVGEVFLPIRQVLAGTGKLSDVKSIRSHPQAIAQCSGKLKIVGKLPKIITKIPSGADYSTAGAMESVAKAKDPSIAAIGSRAAAEKYGLKILVDDLSDMENNETRFFVISKGRKLNSGVRKKTSMIVGLKNKPGSLYEFLGVFAKAGINLSKIESRPSKKEKWSYVFLVDFEGSFDDKKVQEALDSANKFTTYFKVFGSYPSGKN